MVMVAAPPSLRLLSPLPIRPRVPAGAPVPSTTPARYEDEEGVGGHGIEKRQCRHPDAKPLHIECCCKLHALSLQHRTRLYSCFPHAQLCHDITHVCSLPSPPRWPRSSSQVAQGLLWVWPDAASAAEAAVSPPPLTEHWGNKDWTLLVRFGAKACLPCLYVTVCEGVYNGCG